MAKYFLGTVGTAEAFRWNESEKKLELVFVSKTLTDSGLNISTTKDDIRAGQGAPIQFSFYHDPSVEITLTDVLWRKEYLEAQLGASFDDVKHETYMTQEFAFENGTHTLTETEQQNFNIQKLPIPCDNGEQYFVWGAKVGTDTWYEVSYNAGTHTLTLTNDDAEKTGNFCIRTLVADNRATVATISSLIIPQELYLVITAPIFAGDACAASNGKSAGHITFEVPRFQLNGAQEFSMNMSSNQTMSLAGIALASTATECDAEGGKLLRVIEFIKEKDITAEVNALIIDEECLVVGEEPIVYGELKNGTIRKIDNANLTIVPGLNNGKFATAGETTFTLTGTTIEDTATVVA